MIYRIFFIDSGNTNRLTYRTRLRPIDLDNLECRCNEMSDVRKCDRKHRWIDPLNNIGEAVLSFLQKCLKVVIEFNLFLMLFASNETSISILLLTTAFFVRSINTIDKIVASLCIFNTITVSTLELISRAAYKNM